MTETIIRRRPDAENASGPTPEAPTAGEPGSAYSDDAPGFADHLAEPTAAEAAFDDAAFAAEAELYEGVAADAPGEQLIGRDEFASVFAFAIGAPNFVLMARRQEPLKALALDPDAAAVRKASDALYDTCLDVSWLRPLLTPGGKWVERAVAVGALFYGVANAATAELRERREAARADRQPVGDDAPPADAAPAGPAYRDTGVTELRTTHVGR